MTYSNEEHLELNYKTILNNILEDIEQAYLSGRFPFPKRKRKTMQAYPESLPVACIQNIISIIRNREVSAKKQEFFLCLWNAQGYLQRTVVGTPENPSGEEVTPGGNIILPGDYPEVPAEVWQELETTLDEFYNLSSEYNCDNCCDEDTPAYGAEAEAIPWAVIIQLVVPMILKWLENKNK
jgi:hypothetical protein